MNQVQFLAALRNVATFACGILVGKGLINAELGQALIGLVVAIGPVVWSILETRKSSLVAHVNALPEVAGVITQATPEGKALAAANPSPTVATAGTTAAAEVAKNGAH